MALLAFLAVGGCGDDFDRAESTAADATDDDGGNGTIDGAPHNDTSSDGAGSSSGGDATGGSSGGFPGVGKACSAATDCGETPDACVAWTCTNSVCGLAFAKDGAPCDDGEKCTENDACKAGKCEPGVNTCHCNKSADCAKNEDGDLCNGTLYCDTTKQPPVCAVNPVTVKVCHSTNDTDCQLNTCEPKTGACSMQAAKDGKACDDGSACTKNDACKAGKCSGAKGGADDEDACECMQDADCDDKDDGKACNGTLYCDRGTFPFKCAVNPATVIFCSPKNDTACSKNTCQEGGPDGAAGCSMVPMPAKATCDDGNPCTDKDTCKDGKCASGANTCACQTNADCAKHEDGNACNGTLFCDQGAKPVACAVNPASVVTCTDSDDTVCRKNSCDPKSGKCAMTDQAKGTKCEDGNVCTQDDGCDKGVCKSGKNTCKCAKDADCATFDDDNKCNGSLFCDTSAAPFTCELNLESVVTCSGKGNTDCTVEACNPKSGKCDISVKPDGTACDADGNACTAKDACSGGLCKAGKNACACTKDTDCATHEDGNSCNGTLYCDTQTQPFACRTWPLSIVHCQHDGTPCTKTACDPKTGKCAKLPDDEGEVCTAGGGGCFVPGTCTSGACKAGSKTCACTKDADCTDKDDGNLCNGVFYCDKSTTPSLCKPKPKSAVTCDPGKEDGPCKHTVCDPDTGKCAFKVIKAGQPCDDGDVCTPDEECDAKQKCASPNNTSVCGCADASDCQVLLAGNKCLGSYACKLNGGIKACVKNKDEKQCPNGNNPCAENVCDPKTGKCKADPLQHMEGKVCPDNSKCVDVAVCKHGACKPQKLVTCKASALCRLVSCQHAKGCVETVAKDGHGCEDGNKCTAPGTCKSGTCKHGTEKQCNDGNACTKDACDGKTGDCVYTADVGKACTFAADKCVKKAECVAVSLGAQCSPTESRTCDDKDPCSLDSCNPLDGNCVHIKAGSCVKCSTVKDCNAQPCETAKCASGVCQFTPEDGTSCEDGDPCTTGDKCDLGVCKTGAKKTCDDKDKCTTDSCEAKTGNCKHVQKSGCASCSKAADCATRICQKAACNAGKCAYTNTDTAVCDDGDKCTEKTVCKGAKCTGTKVTCNDNDSCTADSCDPKTGCVFKNAANCDDGNVCTTDSCKQGACTHVPASGSCKLLGSTLSCNAGVCGGNCPLWSKTYEADKNGKAGAFEAIEIRSASGSFEVFAVGANNKGTGAPWTARVNDAGHLVTSEISSKHKDMRWRGARIVGQKLYVAGESRDHKNRLTGHIRVLKPDKGKFDVDEDLQVAITSGSLLFHSIEYIGSDNIMAVGYETLASKNTRGLIYRVEDDMDKKGVSTGVVDSRFLGSTKASTGIVVCGDRPNANKTLPKVGLLAAFNKSGKWFRSYHHAEKSGDAIFHDVDASTNARYIAVGAYKDANKKAVPLVAEVDFSKTTTAKLSQWSLPGSAPTTLYSVDLAQEGAFIAGVTEVGTAKRGFVGLIGTDKKAKWLKSYAPSGNSYFWGVRWTGANVIAAGHTHPSGKQRAWMVMLDHKGNLYCPDI